MGAACAALHADNGVELLCGVGVEAVENDAVAARVLLSDGRALAADAVVIGIGAQPNTEWLEGSGLTLEDDVVCDAALRAAPGVFAAGDVARWKNELFGARMRVEQWTNAAEQARHVAEAIAGEDAGAPYRGINYFWSDQYGTRIQFMGIRDADEVVIVDGSVDARRFSAFSRRGERLVGALSVGQPRVARRARGLIERAAAWDEALRAVAQSGPRR
jgi:NADPH-dependent 2,4-dienoyl-CoA reductase/sulfur reductase-like enzyme